MAAETRVLPTITQINVSGNQISILTYYSQSQEVITAFISELQQSIGGVNFIEGEGGITVQGVELNFFVNSDDDGDLIVIGENAGQFSLDEDTGQLVQNT